MHRSFFRSIRRTAALAALAAIPASAMCAAAPLAHAAAPNIDATAQGEQQVLSIAQARKLPIGTKVTVRGSVSTPSGAFESSFGDKGFGLQDGTAGIYVSLQVNVNTAPNDVARVTGVLQDSNGLLIIAPASPDDVQVHCGGPEVRPQSVKTAAVNEATEGRIVRVSGTITKGPTDDAPYGFLFFVNDGSGDIQIFVNVQTGIALSSLHLGQSVKITGFSSQYSDHYEIDPRGPSDIVTAP